MHKLAAYSELHPQSLVTVSAAGSQKEPFSTEAGCLFALLTVCVP